MYQYFCLNEPLAILLIRYIYSFTLFPASAGARFPVFGPGLPISSPFILYVIFLNFSLGVKNPSLTRRSTSQPLCLILQGCVVFGDVNHQSYTVVTTGWKCLKVALVISEVMTANEGGRSCYVAWFV
jgi:hypothetical protein